jgi:hypothetical protein
MGIRFVVGLILIAVGALLTMLGVVAIVNPGGAANVWFRLFFGGMGLVGLLLVFFGNRLRSRAVTESPELLASLHNEGRSQVTNVAKPSFLEPRRIEVEETPTATQQAPQQPKRHEGLYWLLFAVFLLVIVALVVFTQDFFANKDFVYAVSVIGLLLFMLVRFALLKKPINSR